MRADREPQELISCKQIIDRRVSIEIDETLLRAALRATGLKTKGEVVEQGLRTLLRLDGQTEIRELRGKFVWEGDLKSMRSDR
jgi:Arc/MetJ family transcription regulator